MHQQRKWSDKQNLLFAVLLHLLPEPSGPPTLISVGSFNISTLSISWQQPLVTERNGLIIKYTVYWRQAHSSEPFTTLAVADTQVSIFNLLGNNTYIFSISAWTSYGEGPTSANMTAVTGQRCKFIVESAL